MGQIRSAASGKIKGKVGMYSFFSAKKKLYVRASENSSNYGKTARRTLLQQQWRVKFANVVQFYKLCINWIYYGFQNLAAGQTYYNRFMGANLSGSKAFLTKSEVEQGGCVVQPYVLTVGDRTPISYVSDGTNYVTNIACTLADGWDNLTIADFSANVEQLNTWLEDNTQLSLICFIQTLDANNVPRVQCVYYEVTLDTTDESPLAKYLPADYFEVIDGYVCVLPAVPDGAFGMINSRTEDGKTSVSTQIAVTKGWDDLINYYANDIQRNLAIDSYGLDDDCFLESGSDEAGSVINIFQVTTASFNGNIWTADTLIAVPAQGSISATFNFNQSVSEVTKLTLRYAQGTDGSLTTSITDGFTISSDGTSASVTISNSGTSSMFIFGYSITTDAGSGGLSASSASDLGWTQDMGDDQGGD